MIRFSYISTARKEVDEGGVADILAASRRNNAAAGITGLLLYDGKRFLQLLEGELGAVLDTYKRIRHDDRHRACVELSRQEVAGRAFGKWDMAWQRVGDGGEGATLAETVDRLVAQVPDASTRALFEGFARIRRSAA